MNEQGTAECILLEIKT